MVMLMIIVDLSQWQSLREEARRHADRIVLETAQYLPYQTEAQNVLRSQASFFNDSNGLNLNIDSSDPAIASRVRPASVNINVTGSLASGFDFLLEAFTGQDTVFNVSESASARLLPTDLALVISDSINLRPPAPNLWGSVLDWPSSEYFNFVLPPTVSINPAPQIPQAWPNWWTPAQFTPAGYMRFATELCYNPVVTPVKLASLLAVDAISVSEENRLSVYMSPGDIPSNVVGGAGYTILQDLRYADENGASPIWSEYFEPDIAHSDESCVLYSHSEANNLRYTIPTSNTWQSNNTCPQVVLNGLYADPRGHYPNPFTSYLSDCFKQGGMNTREALYYHGVRRNQHEPSGANLARGVFRALTSLVEAEKSNPVSNAQKRRGLARDSVKIVILISEVLPDLGNQGIQDSINIIQSVNNVKLYLVGYYSPELPPNFNQALIARAQEYGALANDRIIVELSTPDTIQAVVASILANEKRVVLST